MDTSRALEVHPEHAHGRRILNTNLGASIALSFVLVTLAAVAFRSPHATLAAADDRQRPALEHTKSGFAGGGQAAAPEPSPASPWSEEDASSNRQARRTWAVERGWKSPVPDALQSASPIDLRPRRRSRLALASSPSWSGCTPRPFTLAREGETLRDICVRIYGNPEAEETLWKVNRDSLTSRSGPVGKGTLLRTP